MPGDELAGVDDHLEMVFEDQVADPLVGSRAYNDHWQDAAYDDMQEYAYEESLEEPEEES